MAMTWNGVRVTAGVRNAIMRGLIGAASDVRDSAIESIISGPKSGIPYARGNRVHIASAPGEPPAQDLGNLSNSITIRPDIKGLVVYVNAAAAYAAALEYGTVRMEPRPYMRPALLRHVRLIDERVALEVRAYLARGGR